MLMMLLLMMMLLFAVIMISAQRTPRGNGLVSRQHVPRRRLPQPLFATKRDRGWLAPPAYGTHSSTKNLRTHQESAGPCPSVHSTDSRRHHASGGCSRRSREASDIEGQAGHMSSKQLTRPLTPVFLRLQHSLSLCLFIPSHVDVPTSPHR